jgi:glutamate-ammonia-ligase adenylyltransferase
VKSAPESPLARARAIDERRAEDLLGDLGRQGGLELGVLLGTAFPPLRPVHDWQFEALERIERSGVRSPRSRQFILGTVLRKVDLDDLEQVKIALRRRTWVQRARIALREALPRSLGGAPVDVTALELSNLAEAGFEVALAEAYLFMSQKFGAPRRADGSPSVLSVFGMGKLGGHELNAGSDVDLILIYDTDDGAAGDVTLHQFWTEVARRAVATIDAPTEDGFVWRVDLRLRPEGSQGPIVYSAAAAERYYETWGRLWERVALLRARPIAGNLDFGATFRREVVMPFVYRREVDPKVATALAELVRRSRTELKVDGERDLKLGRGGIREAEFFVQALQLIWGGNEPTLRVTGTLAALERLYIKGLVTDREAREVTDAYLLLRRAEHAVQWRSGLQTHALPRDDGEIEVLARIVGFPDGRSFLTALRKSRLAVAELFASLSPGGARPHTQYTALLAGFELGRQDVEEAAKERFENAEVGEHLFALARGPDDLLGGRTRDRFPDFAEQVFEALQSSSDPEQAARYLRSFFGRFLTSDSYVAALAADPHALSRFITVLGASAFVGDSIVAHPDLAEILLFGEGSFPIGKADAVVEDELATYTRDSALLTDPQDRRDAFIGALRRAQRRVTLEVAIADLAGALPTRAVTRVLSDLADSVLRHAARFETGDDPKGLALIGVGKLGGGDIGYGSDLDVLFVYDRAAVPDVPYPADWFSRVAQRIVRLISEAHSDGTGYELDTRLRPSGSHGLLVTSIEQFARYHGVPSSERESDADRLTVLSSGAAWERQALLRARAAAGDLELGARVVEVAHAAAYEGGAPPAEEIHHLRMRMETELARERAGRHDLKTGRGGLLDVEFAAQWLQMRHGKDHRVRTTDTVGALHVLHDSGYLSREAFESLRDGYVFLRRLEQRIRIVHGTGATRLDESAGGLAKLARRMAIPATPIQNEAEALLEVYRDTTEVVRRTYLEVLGVS